MSAVAALAEPISPLAGVTIEQRSTHIFCQFEQARPVLSSAISNGGYMFADSILNLWVDGDSAVPLTPEQSLLAYGQTQGWTGTTVGMMTAASMKSFALLNAISKTWSWLWQSPRA